MPLSEHRRTRRRSRSPTNEQVYPRPRRTRSSQVPSPPHSSHKHLRGGHYNYPTLPFGASEINKHDLKSWKPTFALYLEVQKQLDIQELPEKELRGRWKSFVGKWNRGELAEGWYRPETFQKAKAFAADGPHRDAHIQGQADVTGKQQKDADSSSDGEMLGPALPSKAVAPPGRSKRPGPTIPNIQDLELQQENAAEDAFEERENLRDRRRSDRKQQKEQLEEIAPRAEAGTKDRMLEKKREKADANRAFAAGKTESGGVEDVPETDLLGGDDEGIEGYKKQKREMERKKNERELRREEIVRARQAEREERIQQYKEREEQTMSGLIALAKARFG